MNKRKARLGSHCPQISAADGRPVLRLPRDWPGLLIEETIIPGYAECGPQYTGMPILSIGVKANVRRWYRSGKKTLELRESPPAFDIYGASYERDYGCWRGEKGSCIKVSLTPAVIRRYLPDYAPYFDLETCFEHRDTHLRETILSLVHEIKTGLPNGIMYAEGLSIIALGWLNRHYRKQQKVPKTYQKLSAKEQQRIKDFIEVSLDGGITVEKMATLIGSSPSHFFLLFRSTFNMTPHQYVMKRRIARVAQLLKAEPERTITDIAIATGFSSQAHMTHVFKRYMKQTPSRWKAQWHG